MLAIVAFVVAAAGVAPQVPICVLPDGAEIRLELADTDSDRVQGLMFRDHLAQDAGMLFVFEREGLWPFWMKDTFIPLDMIWLDSSGTIVDIRPNVQPCRLDPCPSYWPRSASRAVLEVNAGFASARGLKIGDTLEFRNVPRYPD